MLKNSGSERPNMPIVPAWRKSRRVTPSQKWTLLSASSLNMIAPSHPALPGWLTLIGRKKADANLAQMTSSLTANLHD